MASLPSISAWPSLEQTARLAVLDTLFEPSPELHRLVDTAAVTRQASFASYDALVDAVERSLFALARSAATSPGDRAILLGILGSHPRLGKAAPSPKPGELSEMSALSAREQANLNLGSEEQADRLRLMNAEYEERFPGLRFVYMPPEPLAPSVAERRGR